ncbi:hypothetical protein RB195_003397 [Necator americanus]|uniref:Uncharacterized protein n=1 Tax=Necator americanus TaxID=51031 RepID=A0ABR1DNZ3_NECAM
MEPGARWNPAKYEIDDFDFQELTEMFSELRTGCGSNFNTYFALLRKFVMLSYTSCELDIQVRKFIPAELTSVHERFVYRIIQICDLPIKTRSLSDILNGSLESSSKDKYILPHISSLNALAILCSLGYGWKAPDRRFGELIASAVHTMLLDRIDAALHVRNVPVVNEIGVRLDFQCPSANREQSGETGCVLTASDFLKSFSNKSHWLAAETTNLFKMRCHSNFYSKLKTFVPEEEWDTALEESTMNAPILEQEPGGSADGKTAPQDPVIVQEDQEDVEKHEEPKKKGKGVKRSNSKTCSTAKKKPRKKLPNNVDVNLANEPKNSAS